MLKFGTVKEIVKEEHSVIVTDNITKLETAKLMVLTALIGEAQGWGLPPVNAQVAYIEFGIDQGLVLGGVLDSTKWLSGDENLIAIRVSADRIISYNVETGLLNIKLRRLLLTALILN